jgi:hypothetical protein
VFSGEILMNFLFLFTNIIQVTQIKNAKTNKLDHKIKFMGKTVFEKSYDEDQVFTGPLQTWISDEWNSKSGKNHITQFVYETLD